MVQGGFAAGALFVKVFFVWWLVQGWFRVGLVLLLGWGWGWAWRLLGCIRVGLGRVIQGGFRVGFGVV